ncbi:MAG: hypothetical protein FWC38_10045, partial [Proteobacteria bacterium]|nr:hypothetical protein [Pseudomonadota bacterium]
ASETGGKRTSNTPPALQGLNNVCSALAGLDDGAACLRRFRTHYVRAPPTVTHVARLRRYLECEKKAASLRSMRFFAFFAVKWFF